MTKKRSHAHITPPSHGWTDHVLWEQDAIIEHGMGYSYAMSLHNTNCEDSNPNFEELE